MSKRTMEEQLPMGVEPTTSDVPSEPELTMDPEFLQSEINEDNRVPFGSFSQRLAYPAREGYHRHWFNDSPGRVARALQAGFKHVTDAHTGGIVKRPVGTAVGGGALVGYLMEIPNHWWEKDQKLLQDRVDATDADIRRGNIEGKVGTDGRYIPQARPIKIKDVARKERLPSDDLPTE